MTFDEFTFHGAPGSKHMNRMDEEANSDDTYSNCSNLPVNHHSEPDAASKDENEISVDGLGDDDWNALGDVVADGEHYVQIPPYTSSNNSDYCHHLAEELPVITPLKEQNQLDESK